MKERLSIKLLENDLQELNKTSFDDQTLALLRGETIRFYMKSNQVFFFFQSLSKVIPIINNFFSKILIGKKTKTQDETISIDLDLSSEKNCQKISRSQVQFIHLMNQPLFIYFKFENKIKKKTKNEHSKIYSRLFYHFQRIFSFICLTWVKIQYL